MKGNAAQHKQARHLAKLSCLLPRGRLMARCVRLSTQVLLYTACTKQLTSKHNAPHLVIIEHLHIKAPGVVASAPPVHPGPVSSAQRTQQKQAREHASHTFLQGNSNKAQSASSSSDAVSASTVSLSMLRMSVYRVPGTAPKSNPPAQGRSLRVLAVHTIFVNSRHVARLGLALE